MSTKTKSRTHQPKPSSVPRLVRVPLVLDQWLEQQVAASSGTKTVAQQIREILKNAYEATRGRAAA